MSDVWLCLGSSPSAPAMLPVAQRDYPGATTITTNGGIKLLTPDYYLLSDPLARRMYGKQARALRVSHGLKLIAFKAKERPDILLGKVASRGCGAFARGVYTEQNLSGMYTVQFALNNGAKTIAAVGHEGYPRHKDEPMYWDQTEPTAEYLCHYTDVWIAPFWRDAVKECPDVAFHFYGNLQYMIDGPNVLHTVTA